MTHHPSASATVTPPPDGGRVPIRRQGRFALAGLALVGLGAVGTSAQQVPPDSTPRGGPGAPSAPEVFPTKTPTEKANGHICLLNWCEQP